MLFLHERRWEGAMPSEPTNLTSPGDRLCAILLHYLQDSCVVCWPGVDGLTAREILESYPKACSLGEVPGCRELCDRHQDLSAEIATFFTVNGWPATSRWRPRPPLPGGLPVSCSDNQAKIDDVTDAAVKLSRWRVSFASGAGWYPVGEFLALDAATAIERAIEVFGPGVGYQAEEVPWDAAPLFKAPASDCK
jgi:hypothetical protein